MKQLWVILFAACLIPGYCLAENSSADSSLQYKGIHIKFGGFLASETVYRSSNTESDIGTSFSKIPFQNSLAYDQSEFRGTERQSRFSLLAQGDTDAGTRIAGYYELDFLGSSPTANPNESNSFTPRTRNVYMTVDWDDIGFHLLAGQSWSLVTLNSKGITPRNEYIPPTINAQYAVGFDWARQWQFRLVKDWNKKYWAALSFENAQTVGVGGSGGTGNTYQLPAGALYNSGSMMSINEYPDVVAKVAFESDYGHYEIYNLMRNFQSHYGGNTTALQTNHQNMWTDAVGAGATVPLYPKVVDLAVSGLFGKGVGRYGTAGLNDATYASDGSLLPLNGKIYLAQLNWHATSAMDVYLTYGQEQVDSAVGANNASGYGDGIVSSNSGCTILGGTSCNPDLKSVAQSNLGFWWSFYKGRFGVAKFGGQYSHTVLTAFADSTGLAPKTAEDMVFTSLRYYPF